MSDYNLKYSNLNGDTIGGAPRPMRPSTTYYRDNIAGLVRDILLYDAEQRRKATRSQMMHENLLKARRKLEETIAFAAELQAIQLQIDAKETTSKEVKEVQKETQSRVVRRRRKQSRVSNVVKSIAKLDKRQKVCGSVTYRKPRASGQARRSATQSCSSVGSHAKKLVWPPSLLTWFPQSPSGDAEHRCSKLTFLRQSPPDWGPLKRVFLGRVVPLEDGTTIWGGGIMNCAHYLPPTPPSSLSLLPPPPFKPHVILEISL